MEGVECAAAECAGGVAEDSAAEADMEEDSSCLGVSVAAGACVASSLSFSLSLSLSLSRSRSRSRALSLSLSLSLVLDLRAEFFFGGGHSNLLMERGESLREAPCGTGNRETLCRMLEREKERQCIAYSTSTFEADVRGCSVLTFWCGSMT